jgi:hypothetical protein
MLRHNQIVFIDLANVRLVKDQDLAWLSYDHEHAMLLFLTLKLD